MIADLTGRPLRAALRGGVALLRLSDEELAAEQYAASNAPSDLVAAARGLQAAGAQDVLVSRAAEPALLVGDGEPRSSCSSPFPASSPPDHRHGRLETGAAIGAALPWRCS